MFIGSAGTADGQNEHFGDTFVGRVDVHDTEVKLRSFSETIGSAREVPVVKMGSLVQYLPKLGLGNIHINYRRHAAGYSSTRTMLNLDSESAGCGDGCLKWSVSESVP